MSKELAQTDSFEVAPLEGAPVEVAPVEVLPVEEKPVEAAPVDVVPATPSAPAASMFADKLALAKDESFIERVAFAAVKIAIAVSSEAESTPNHARRVTFAKSVLSNPDTAARNLALGVATNVAISTTVVRGKDNATGEKTRTATTTATDQDIEFTVSSVWNAYAGVM